MPPQTPPATPSPTPPVVAAPPPAPPAQPPAASPSPSPAAKKQLVSPEFLDGLYNWLFVLGFASIFLINSAYALWQPKSFTDLLYNNPVTNAIGLESLMVKFVVVNDLILGLLILLGKRKKLVYAYAGIWLLIVAGIKLMNLFV